MTADQELRPRHTERWSVVIALVMASLAIGASSATSNEEFESEVMPKPTGASTPVEQAEVPTVGDMVEMQPMRELVPAASRSRETEVRNERSRPARNDALDLVHSVGRRSEANLSADPPILLPPTRVRKPVATGGGAIQRVGDLLASQEAPLYSVARTCDPDDPKNQVFVRNESVSPATFVEPL